MTATCTMVLALTIGCQWATGKTQPAVASYYHEDSHIATGERYDKHGITAAHRTLPFGSRVLVRYRKPGHGERAVVVVINDCGPAGWTKRDIDLSLGAAQRIGMLKEGVVNVRIETLSVPAGARHRTNCNFNVRPARYRAPYRPRVAPND